MDKIKAILKFGMRMEKDAGDFYTYYMDKVKSPATKELFRELAEIEKKHYEVLKAKSDKLGFEEPPLTISWVVDDSFKAVDPHILADNSDIIGDTDAPDLTVIRMAYLIENDFALFYKNAAEQVDGKDVKQFLNELSEWESQHRKLFYEKYQVLLKKQWSDIAPIIFS